MSKSDGLEELISLGSYRKRMSRFKKLMSLLL
jgi:hypothetical protein